MYLWEMKNISCSVNFVLFQSIMIKPNPIFDKVDSKFIWIFMLHSKPTVWVHINLKDKFTERTSLEKFSTYLVLNVSERVEEFVCRYLPVTQYIVKTITQLRLKFQQRINSRFVDVLKTLPINTWKVFNFKLC